MTTAWRCAPCQRMRRIQITQWSIDLTRNGNSGCANEMQNATFDENPHENERIWVILGCAISSIACAKHGCTGGWLILCNEVGPRHAIYSRKSSLDAGGLVDESGIVLVRCLAVPRQIMWPYASTRKSGSIRQLSLQSKFLPSFREQYSPPNPESASIGHNLGRRNYETPQAW